MVDVDAGRETTSPEYDVYSFSPGYLLLHARLTVSDVLHSSSTRLASAHQATRAALGVSAAAAAAAAGFAESPITTPQSREAILTIAGASGYGSFINGTYDVTPDNVNVSKQEIIQMHIYSQRA